MLENIGVAVNRRHLQGLALLLGLLGAIWVLTSWIVAGTPAQLVLGGLGLLAGAILLNILNDWRSGFYLSLVWLLFEDLARKYLSNNMYIYFGKDVLIGMTYLSFFLALRRRQAETFRPSFLFPLSLFFWLAVAQMFNPGSPSLLYGLLGLKLYFYYVPLMFVGYALIRSERDLHRLLVVNLVMAGVIALLGVMQTIEGPTFLNPQVLAPELTALGRLTRVAPISGTLVTIPTSVFVSGGRFGWYMVLTWLLGLGSVGYFLLHTRRGRKTAFVSIAVMAAGILVSGSRSAVVWALCNTIVMATGFLWSAPWKWGQANRLLRAIRRTLLLAGLGVAVVVWYFPTAMGARWDFYSETLSPVSPSSELAWRSWGYPVQNFLLAFENPLWPYGYGTGTSSLGVQYVSRLLEQPTPKMGVESGFGALIVEMGVLGPTLWLAWTGSLLLACWRVVRRLKGTPHFPLGFAIFWFAFLLLIAFTFVALAPYQNFVLNAYLWLLVGILFRLPTLGTQFPHHVSVAEHHLAGQHAIAFTGGK